MSGIGIDLLEVGRLEDALARHPRLAERLFTDAERDYAAAKARPAMHLAARFCAKEAVAKALDLRGWSFRDVEVIATDGAPEVRLRGSAATRADELGVTAHLSITHTDVTAGAAAILVPGQDSPPSRRNWMRRRTRVFAEEPVPLRDDPELVRVIANVIQDTCLGDEGAWFRGIESSMPAEAYARNILECLTIGGYQVRLVSSSEREAE